MKTKLLLLCLLPFLSFSQANDLAIDSVFHRSGVGGYFEHGLTYYKIPESQSSPIQFSALVSNEGMNDLTGCYLTSEVWLDGLLEISLISPEIDIAAGTSDSLIIPTSYEPIEQGDYEFKFFVSSDSLDEAPFNDTLTVDIEVTQQKWSRSTEVLMDTISPLDSLDDFGGIGAVFEIFNGVCIGGLWPKLMPDTSGLNYEIVAYLYEYNYTTSVFEIVDESEEENFSFFDGGGGTYLGFESGPEFEAGDIVMLVLVTYMSTPFLGLSQPSENGSTYYLNSGIELKPNLGKVPNFDIGIDLAGNCTYGTPESKQSNFSLGQSYPNPALNSLTIPFVLANNSQVNIQIEDQIGRIIYSEDFAALSAGENSVQINTQNWAPGVYFYSLMVDGEIQTKSLVVE